MSADISADSSATPPRIGDSQSMLRIGDSQSMLRIGMVCPYSLTIPGGVQHQVLGLARSLRARGHEVRVLGPCDGPPPASFVTPLGDSLPTSANGSIAPLAPDPSAALRTIRALNDEAFDVLHLHEPFAPGPTQTAVFVKLAPIVATFHMAGSSAGYKVFRRPLSHFVSRLDVRCVVSKDALQLVSEFFPGDYEVLFNGIELEQYESAAQPARAPTSRAIFFIGRHEPRKGLEVLLQAMDRLPSDVTLWVASDGPDTARLRAQYGNDSRVEWLGRISDDEKVRRLQSAAAFCAPSLHGESFGVVLLEAMAAGAPVVASSLDGYRNVATHEVDALLVEPGDPVELAAGLSRVLDDAPLAARLIEAGQSRSREYSMDELAARYEVLYRRALDIEAAAGSAVRVPRMLKRFEGRFLRGPRERTRVT